MKSLGRLYFNSIYVTISVIALFCFTKTGAQPTIFTNNGATVQVANGGIMILKTGNLLNAAGVFDNNGTVTIEGDCTNNSLLNGGIGSIYFVQSDWINNLTFNHQNGKVELYGLNQNIGGVSLTQFFDLTLSGAGIKTQTINSEVQNTLDITNVELATQTYIMSVSNPNVGAVQRVDGFVSSLGLGRLSRATNSNGSYLFPTGSSLGFYRYRPVSIVPSTILPQTFAVRFANNDPDDDGYDNQNLGYCMRKINQKFYHFIEQPIGLSAATFAILYDASADGLWSTAANYNGIPTVWNDILATPSFVTQDVMTCTNWTAFSPAPYVLAKPDLLDASINPNQNICQGYGAPLSVGGGTSYYWYPNTDLDCTTCNDPHANPEYSTIYNCIVSNDSGCKDTFSTTVTVNPTITIDATTSSYFAYNGVSIQFNTSGTFDSISWTPTQYLDEPNLPNPTANIYQDITYTIYAEDTATGCFATDTLNIRYEGCLGMDMPSAFSPNNDGENDILRPLGYKAEFFKSMQVYNRWGEKVYESNDVNSGWDGYYKGVQQEIGTYVFILIGSCDGKEKNNQGNVSLLR